MLWKLLNRLKFESSKAAPGLLVAALQITFISRHLHRHTNHIQCPLSGIITKDAFVPFAVAQEVCKYVGDKVGNRPIGDIEGCLPIKIYSI